jgi:hypothetical protein
VDIIQEKTIDKDLGTKSEAMGFQLEEISLSKKV